MNKEPLLSFSDLVSLVEQQENIEKTLQTNIDKTKDFQSIVAQQFNTYADIKHLLVKNPSFSNKYLWITAYIASLFTCMSLLMNIYHISLLHVVSVIFTLCSIFFTYSTFYFFNSFRAHHFPKFLNFVLSLDSNHMLKILSLQNKSNQNVESLKNSYSSPISKTFLAINSGAKYKFNSEILNLFSHPDPSYFSTPTENRNQAKINRIKSFLDLLIYFNQDKTETKKTSKLSFINFIYVPFICSFASIFFADKHGYILSNLIYSILLILFSLGINYTLRKNSFKDKISYYLKVYELQKFVNLSDFKESMITIGFFEPDDILSMNEELTVDSFIQRIKDLTPEKQDLIIKSLTQIINMKLSTFESPIIFK